MQNRNSSIKVSAPWLSDELKLDNKKLSLRIDELEKEINVVTKKQDHLLSPDEEYTVFIDTLIEYSSKIKTSN